MRLVLIQCHSIKCLLCPVTILTVDRELQWQRPSVAETLSGKLLWVKTGAVPTQLLFRTAQGAWDHGLHWSIQNLHILPRIFSLEILYFEGKIPLLIKHSHIRFGGTLPETSKSSAFWDMGVKSHLTWLLLFSPDVVLANQTAPVYYEFWSVLLNTEVHYCHSWWAATLRKFPNIFKTHGEIIFFLSSPA